jgi:hypothetical protein
VRRFERLCFAPDCLVRHAQAFGRERFERELVALVRETLDARRSGERMTWN